MTRSVLVAGGDRGVGKAIAARFAAQDDWVAVTYRGIEPPGDMLAVPCDLTDTSQVEAAYREVEDAHGPVEVLVANAEITCDGPLLHLQALDDTAPEITAGSMPLVERVVEEMRWGDWGRIILIVSAVEFQGEAGPCGYISSADALVGFARSLGRDLASHGVTVNVVAPVLPTEDMSRLARPEDVAAVVNFLASPDASHITGTLVPVNGQAATGT
ncbi:SDR family NAD(P)-dependent oxidoreductase [Streptomyces sp. NPDC060064]|uniref:SDR family NAD(P)-dependent oxidoreductase n=1 Tax=Streptomyces sp. NPDC060064 TaxID=3347049 RepID=UPI00367B1301